MNQKTRNQSLFKKIIMGLQKANSMEEEKRKREEEEEKEEEEEEE